MRHNFSQVVAVAALIGCPIVAAVADDSTLPSLYSDSPESTGSADQDDGDRVVLTGVVVRINEDTGRLALRDDTHRRYNVDTSKAEVVTPDVDASKNADDLAAGARVCVVGYRYSAGQIEADYVTVLPSNADSKAPATPKGAPVVAHVDTPAGKGASRLPQVRVASIALPAAAPITATRTSTTAAPVVASSPAPKIELSPSSADPVETVRVDAVISSVTPGDGELSATGDDKRVYQVKARDADIIVPRVARAGALDDLHQGMRVHLIGECGAGSLVQADRIEVLVADDPPAPAVSASSDLSAFTGVLIDTRALSLIQRSPSPAIYGPDMSLLYPDRSHVPTPDDVQDESIIRYYRSEDAADAGVGGTHPLILNAEKVIGPAEDGVMLSAEDAALFKALDQRLQYSRNWKVGFLIPADR